MLGFYANFPKTIHATEHFSVSISTRRLQQVLIEALQKLNEETLNLDDIADPSVHQCQVNLELGIAEATDFNYFNREEESKLHKEIQKKPLQILDFFCAIRYHTMREQRKRPLRFDYYMLRLTFEEGSMDMQVVHERGPRYLSPNDIINLMARRANEAFPKRVLKALGAS